MTLMERRSCLKILIVLYYYHPYVSGLSLLAKTLAEGLAARGHSVTILTTRYQDGLAGCEEVNGVKIIRAEVLAKVGKGIISLDFLGKLVSLAKSHDIINPHLPMAHFGLVSSLIDHDKVVTQYHCDLNLGQGAINLMLERFSYWSMDRTLRLSTRIIATTRDYFLNCRFSRYADKVIQIYPPIDRNRFGKVPTVELQERLGIRGYPRLIGFVGRIVEEKGLEYLLQTIPYLQDCLDDFQILIAGDYENVAGGSIKSRLDGLAAHHSGHVNFVGHLKFPDLVAFYNLIDVLVLPSVDPLEAFGMVQLEAMLCGTPVIASDMPGIREVVAKTGYGKLARPRDPRDIAGKIIDLLDNPVDIRQEDLSIFDFVRSIDQYEQVFTDLAAGSPVY